MLLGGVSGHPEAAQQAELCCTGTGAASQPPHPYLLPCLCAGSAGSGLLCAGHGHRRGADAGGGGTERGVCRQAAARHVTPHMLLPPAASVGVVKHQPAPMRDCLRHWYPEALRFMPRCCRCRGAANEAAVSLAGVPAAAVSLATCLLLLRVLELLSGLPRPVRLPATEPPGHGLHARRARAVVLLQSRHSSHRLSPRQPPAAPPRRRLPPTPRLPPLCRLSGCGSCGATGWR